LVAAKLQAEIEYKYLGKCLNSCYVKPHASTPAGCSLLYGKVATVCELESLPEGRGPGKVNQCYTLCCFSTSKSC
jgi:hypothetical protein